MLNNLDPPWQWNYGQFTTSLGWNASKIYRCIGPRKAVRWRWLVEITPEGNGSMDSGLRRSDESLPGTLLGGGLYRHLFAGAYLFQCGDFALHFAYDRNRRGGANLVSLAGRSGPKEYAKRPAWRPIA